MIGCRKLPQKYSFVSRTGDKKSVHAGIILTGDTPWYWLILVDALRVLDADAQHGCAIIFCVICAGRRVIVDLLWMKALERSQTASLHLQHEHNTLGQVQFSTNSSI